MIDETKTADDAKMTVEPEAAPRKRGRRSNGKAAAPAQERSNGKAVAPAQERSSGKAVAPPQERSNGKAAVPTGDGTTAAIEGVRRRRGRSSNGKSGPYTVPGVKVRASSTSRPSPNSESPPEVETLADPMSTRVMPTVDGEASPDGSQGGQANQDGSQLAGRMAHARPGEVRPVKVRVSDGYGGGLVGRAGNGHNGSTEYRVMSSEWSGPRARGGFPDGYRGRVSPYSDGGSEERGATTRRLRDTDITGLRFRLKREEWAYPRPARRGPHKRPLPYFLMRHRSIRSRSLVGHARSQAARRRYGKGGPMVVAAWALVGVIVLTSLAGGAGMGGAAAAASWYIENKLPPVTEAHGINVQTTKIYDRNGTPLFDIVDEQTGLRKEVNLSEVSPWVISATIATEDASFYSNPGVDAYGIVRALYINASGKGRSGGSTITQQVVRQVNLPEDERLEDSLSRKIREAIQALRFTQYYSKDDILKMYLNENYYGHRAYGIEAAALTYFGKHARDLNLPEASLLAGLPQAPTEYDPVLNTNDIAKRRQATVLNLMYKQGMITAQAEREAADGNLVLHEYKPPTGKAPHFVYYVKQYLENLYGPDVSNAGLIVTTTLDLKVQAAAEKVARDRIEELRRQRATNAAIVVIRPNTGEILAMVGSVDYNNKAIDGQVNVATAERQPGSSFKPITYATAFKKGWTPGTVVLDTLTAFPNPGQKPYIPKNYDGRDHGWVAVREALGNSYNIPAVKALQFAGVQNVIDTAHDLGIKGLNRGLSWYGLSLTLGGGEVTLLDMTNAYSTFANGGVEVDANPILKIEDPQGRIIECNGTYKDGAGDCTPIQQRQFGDGRGQVLDPRQAHMINSILSDNRARSSAFGPNSPLKLGFTAAAKTGTTDDNRDSWTLGYTPNVAVGVWVGNSNNSQMLKVTGAIGAAVVWHNMMTAFYSNPDFVSLVRDSDGTLREEFVQPPGLIRGSACSNKGTITDLFLKEAPARGCTTYKDKNPQLHSAPDSNPNSKPTPKAKPTPLPGIWPPLNP